jgi:hypothetical protein
MDKNTKYVYDILQDIFKNVWEQQKYSELKNSILLTFNLAIFILIIKTNKEIIINFKNDSMLVYIFFILFVIFIIHIVLIIQSFFPKDKNYENIKYSNKEINIFFFGDIQKVQSEQYLNIVLERFNIKEDINKDVLLNLSNQIIIISTITQFKYQSFKNSIYRMYVLGFLFLIFYSYIVFNCMEI